MADLARADVDAAFCFGFLQGALFGGIAALIGALMAFGVWRWW